MAEEEPPLRLCGYSMANPLRSLVGQRSYKYSRLMFVEVGFFFNLILVPITFFIVIIQMEGWH